jgi:hypothetical protein
MRHWIGRWLMGVAIIHISIAVVVHHRVLFLIMERGVFNTVADDAVVGAIVWSIFFGVVAFIGGLTVNALERLCDMLPKSLGWSLLALATIGIVLVPISGFWLIFPPAISILVKKSNIHAP